MLCLDVDAFISRAIYDLFSSMHQNLNGKCARPNSYKKWQLTFGFRSIKLLWTWYYKCILQEKETHPVFLMCLTGSDKKCF